MACTDRTPMADIVVKVGVDEDESSPSHTLGCLRKIGFPKLKRDQTEDTCLDDTTFIKSFCSGYAEPEDLDLTIRFDSDQYDFLLEFFQSNLSRTWTIEFPLVSEQVTRSKWTFDSWLKELGGSEQVAGNSEKVDVMLKVFPQNMEFTPAT